MMIPSIPPKETRKTRFVCISDTHSASPADGAFKLPKGDVLVHAGDLTNQGSLSELKKTLEWIEKADFEVKIVIAGNHDITLDAQFYAQHGRNFHNQHPEDPDVCLALLRSSPVIYLEHSSADITLTNPSGPQTSFRVFGSPYVPARGNWAFGYDAHSPPHAADLWAAIPLDTDVVVTHTPAYNHCDASPKWGAAGCEELRRALWRVRPRLAVCGHVHEARGVERVKWRLDLPRCPFLEQETVVWTDPGAGNQRLSLVSLTSRGGAPINNDGERGEVSAVSERVCFSDDGAFDLDNVEAPSDSSDDSFVSATDSETMFDEPLRVANRPSQGNRSLSALTHRRSSGPDQRSVDPLKGRMGRKETCVINAAIMAKSWGKGPKRFNKPIVVDVDLPLAAQDQVEEEAQSMPSYMQSDPDGSSVYSRLSDESMYTSSSYASTIG